MRKEEGEVKKPSSDDSNRLKDVNASCYFHHAACHRRRRVLRGVLLFWSEDHRGETAGSHSSICMKFVFFSLCAHIQTKARNSNKPQNGPQSAARLCCNALQLPAAPRMFVSLDTAQVRWLSFCGDFSFWVTVKSRGRDGRGGGGRFGIRTSEYTNASNQLSHRSEHTSSWTTKDERKCEERVSYRNQSESGTRLQHVALTRCVFKNKEHPPDYPQSSLLHLHMMPEVLFGLKTDCGK